MPGAARGAARREFARAAARAGPAGAPGPRLRARRFRTPHETSHHPTPKGHLLKDQLEVVKLTPPDGGRPRYTIKPLEDELPFDKVQG